MSNMSTKPCNSNDGCKNLTLIGGCQRLERKWVGFVADEVYIKNLLPHIEPVFKGKGLKL